MLEEYKAKVLQLMLGGLYGFDIDSFKVEEGFVTALNNKGNEIKMNVFSIDCNIGNNCFIFNPEWFREEIKSLAILSYNNGFILINHSKIRRYLIEFKQQIQRIEKGVCSLQNKYLPNDNSYWVVKKRKMTDEEIKSYKRDS